MKLTEKQIWQCNNTEDGGVHICLDHQNIVNFARSIEQEIGFTKAELWLKRIDDAIKVEREECAKLCEELVLAHPGRADLTANQCADSIRARNK